MTTPDRFLRRRDMLATVGIPQSTVYLMMSRGEFPRSYQITRRLVGWRLSEVSARLEGRPSHQHRPPKAAQKQLHPPGWGPAGAKIIRLSETGAAKSDGAK